MSILPWYICYTHVYYYYWQIFPTGQVSLGALGDSFYEYLVKSWIGTSKKDVEAKDMYFPTIRVCITWNISECYYVLEC